MLPAALTMPAVDKLPLIVLPTTLKLAKLPTCVRLEYNTFELNVLPVNAAALILEAVTPVSCEPLPMK